MKLQLSSEEESDGEGRNQNKAESSQGNATITLGAQSSLNSTDQRLLVQKILHNTANSYNSSEYRALKMSHPKMDIQNTIDRSSGMNISMDKNSVYQMQPKFPMLHPSRSRTRDRKNHRTSTFAEQHNGTDYSESNPTDSLAQRYNDYGGSPEGRD